MNDLVLGMCACSVCGELAPVKASKKGKAYQTCSGCGCQVFARGGVADRILKERAGYTMGESETLQPVAPQPVATARRFNSEKGKAKPVEVEEAKPEAPAKDAEENTIFDILGKWAAK